MPEARTVRAPAKVNLVLEVLGPRADGYHEIDSVLQELALADTVRVGWGARAGIGVSGPYAEGCPADASNLAWRAAEALARAVRRPPGNLRIGLTKRIPPAGGLGGGASDAGAVLRALGEAWHAPRSTLNQAAAEVGSDVPFFLTGGTARARGRGERIGALAPLSPHGVVLVLAPATLDRKTGRLYGALGTRGFDDGRATATFLRRHPHPLRTTDLFNAFERVAFDQFEGLAELRSRAEAVAGEPLRLAGAGPTLFWIGPVGEARGLANRLRKAGIETLLTRTAGPR